MVRTGYVENGVCTFLTILCTGTYYFILIPLSVGVSQYLNRFNKYIFEKTVPTISVRDLLLLGTGTNFRCVTRKGKWPFHLRPDTNSYVLPKHLVFEDG
jgi:hypothetical protein